MIMASRVQPDLDCSPLIELLKTYNSCPTPQGRNWAEENWQSPSTIAEQIKVLAKENKARPGKEKTVVCGVLGAALMAAQKDKRTVKQPEREASELLPDLIKSLQAELEAEWKKRVQAETTATRLQNQLRDAFVREREWGSELAEARREDLERECGHCGGTDITPEIITKEIPYSATELAKLQEKYSRVPRETETEYVWRVSLTGEDRIKLSEEAAQGYWGPGVFLTLPNTRAPWSLTQREAYWAGGLDPLEWGDPVTIPTPGQDQITESIQKATCLQLMHDRCLTPHQPSPMLLKADPSQMKPLIKGLPDPLKLYAIQIQDRLRAVLPNQEHLTEMLTPGRNLGSGMMRSQLWREGLRKEIPRELMDGLPLSNLQLLVKAWKDPDKAFRREERAPAGLNSPSVPPLHGTPGY
ncbi:hypothetical protein QYF61_025674 [Mycteria americana]|uniref:Uncharacterized protein n=1 Tax=Mycteria americana TaxID=33587 RepID=A0AAN7Q909_MYCAM|nr:hypothetical protein QYF61_025674 [Mycteria americana]